MPYKLTAEAMLFVAAILRLGESAQMAHPIDADSQDRMVTCLEVLVSFWLHMVVLTLLDAGTACGEAFSVAPQ